MVLGVCLGINNQGLSHLNRFGRNFNGDVFKNMPRCVSSLPFPVIFMYNVYTWVYINSCVFHCVWEAIFRLPVGRRGSP